MAVNPLELMKMKERLTTFHTQHPRVGAFLSDVSANAIREGSIVELKVTSPEGREYVTNIRVTSDDMKTLDILKNMKG